MPYYIECNECGGWLSSIKLAYSGYYERLDKIHNEQLPEG